MVLRQGHLVVEEIKWYVIKSDKRRKTAASGSDKALDTNSYARVGLLGGGLRVVIKVDSIVSKKNIASIFRDSY
jgi:hypothetical protein